MQQVAAAVEQLHTDKLSEKIMQAAQVDGIAKKLDEQIQKLSSLVDGLKVCQRVVYANIESHHFNLFLTVPLARGISLHLDHCRGLFFRKIFSWAEPLMHFFI